VESRAERKLLPFTRGYERLFGISILVNGLIRVAVS
jgi:hypothetical protein